NSPVADDAAETVGFPTIKGSSDDTDVGRAGFEVATQFGDEFVAVTEAAVPGENESPGRGVGALAPCLTINSSRMLIEDTQRVDKLQIGRTLNEGAQEPSVGLTVDDENA